MPGIESWSSSL